MSSGRARYKWTKGSVHALHSQRQPLAQIYALHFHIAAQLFGRTASKGLWLVPKEFGAFDSGEVPVECP